MTQAELFQALESIGYPVAYNAFSKPTPLPYIVYKYSFSSDMVADNVNYAEIGNFQIELYTEKKDTAAEKKVQDKLRELGLPYRKFEAFLDTEGAFQILYEIQLIGG